MSFILASYAIRNFVFPVLSSQHENAHVHTIPSTEFVVPCEFDAAVGEALMGEANDADS